MVNNSRLQPKASIRLLTVVQSGVSQTGAEGLAGFVLTLADISAVQYVKTLSSDDNTAMHSVSSFLK